MIPHSKPDIGKAEEKAVIDVLRCGQIAKGSAVSALERAFGGYIGVKNAAAVSSGTAGLHLSLMALGVKQGDEVILPSYTCTALLNAVNYTGATAVLTDIDRDSYNISFDLIKEKLTKKTRAVIVPHMFGCPAAEIAKIIKLGVPVIEDCAQAAGAMLDGRRVGSFGTVSVFSFYAAKLVCAGEGGMVLCNDRKIMDRVRGLADYDEKEDYEIRYNYKLTDIQAALAMAQLKRLNGFIKTRKKIAAEYNRAFSRLQMKLPSADKGRIYFRYIVETEKNVDECIAAMEKAGVRCRRPVFKPLHRYLKLGGFPAAQDAWEKAVSIPIYTSLKNTEIMRIIKIVKALFYP